MGTVFFGMGACHDTFHGKVKFFLPGRESIPKQPFNVKVFGTHKKFYPFFFCMCEHIKGGEPPVGNEDGDAIFRQAVAGQATDCRMLIFLPAWLDDGVCEDMVCKAVGCNNMYLVISGF